MRSRAPEPVDLHGKREDVIIKKNDLIDRSEGFLDIIENERTVSRERRSVADREPEHIT